MLNTLGIFRVHIVFIFLIVTTTHAQNANEKYGNNAVVYMKVYPEFITGKEGNYIIWKDGTRMNFDDGISNKTFEQKLNDPDLEGQISMHYPAGKKFVPPPAENYDPGRIRYEPFFKKMYGNSQEEVEKNIVTIHWMPKTVDTTIRVTSINGVDKKLKKISRKFDKLPDELKKYVSEIACSYEWRNIAETDRLSVHSFGIAVDISLKHTVYWEWDLKAGNMYYHNQIPQEIVNIFEKHGFIWGGKWYHYDTMHFEYRPEMLLSGTTYSRKCRLNHISKRGSRK
jgi:hypothetical protein